MTFEVLDEGRKSGCIGFVRLNFSHCFEPMMEFHDRITQSLDFLTRSKMQPAVPWFDSSVESNFEADPFFSCTSSKALSNLLWQRNNLRAEELTAKESLTETSVAVCGFSH
jgi:hypothetical protein